MAGRGLRALPAAILAGALALAAAAPALAGPAHGSASASEQDGYGRIVLSFDGLPSYHVEIRNDILIARFDAPIDMDIKAVPAGVPDYVAIGRIDPDRRAVRFSLRQDVIPHTIQGGDKLFIDLLPAGWKGMPPGLPADVLADMNRKLQTLDRQARRVRSLATADLKPLTLRAGTHDGLLRVSFDLGQPVEASFARQGDTASLTVSAPLPFDLAAARSALPAAISALKADTDGNRLTLSFDAPAAWADRTFREGDTLVVDFFTNPGKTANTAPVPGLTVAPLPKPIEAPLSPRQQRGAMREPQTTGSTPAPQSARRLLHRTASRAPAPAIVPAVFQPEAGPAAPAVSAAAPPAAANDATVRPIVRRAGTALEITFPFAQLPAAAVFSRGSYLWLVFDSATAVDPTQLREASEGLVSQVRTMPADGGHALLLHLSAPRLVSLAVRDGRWVLALGDSMLSPSAPIDLTPAFSPSGRTMISAALGSAGSTHWLTDPLAGDRIAVTTLPPPVRSVVKPRHFVDFQALETTQGVAIVPHADDVAVQLAGKRLTVTRDSGLTLSSGQGAPAMAALAGMPVPDAPVFDATSWNKIRAEPDRDGARRLIAAAAQGSPAEAPAALMALARFQLVHGDAAAAEGALELALAEQPALARDPTLLLLRGAAQVELRHFAAAQHTLSAAPLAANAEAALWRGVAERELGAIAQARQALREGQPVLRSMPDALQIRFRDAAVRAAIAVRDFAEAAAQLDAADALHQPEGKFARAVLRGHIDEGLGRSGAALDAYRSAINSDDPIAAAAARLAAARLRYSRKEISRAETIDRLEDLAAMWRGDQVEAGALALLAHLYREDKRWRDAFTALRSTVRNYPDAQTTRDAQDEMSEAFSNLFLGNGAEAAPPTLESVALFYDFKELMPTGQRGDEMVRGLADRLVQVDLLDKAGSLLDYQVEHRLASVERAEVAARAAFIHLLNRKPGRAERILQMTRIAGLPDDLVRNRLLLEAQALSELSRPELALELIEGYQGNDVQRLRADILWNAQQWQRAGEALELLVGDSWKSPGPLPDEMLTDVLRSAISYALADDPIALDRIRAKFAAEMSAGPGGPAFDAVTAPIQNRGTAFQEVARAVSAIDTMETFLKDYRKRYPDTGTPMPAPPAAPAPTRGAANTAAPGQKSAS